MTTLKELHISSMAEPCQVEIERNSKGYNYHLNLHAEDMQNAIETILNAKATLDKELYGEQPIK